MATRRILTVPLENDIHYWYIYIEYNSITRTWKAVLRPSSSQSFAPTNTKSRLGKIALTPSVEKNIHDNQS